MRTKLLTSAAVLLAALATAAPTAGAHCGSPDYHHGTRRLGSIEHPGGARDVVLRTQTSRNFWGGQYPDAARFTLYGDGHLVSHGTTRRITEAEVQRILAGARRAGLLGPTDFGHPLVTDQGTTRVEIRAGGVHRTLDLYALELVEGDRGLTRAQRHARRTLRAFLHGV